MVFARCPQRNPCSGASAFSALFRPSRWRHALAFAVGRPAEAFPLQAPRLRSTTRSLPFCSTPVEPRLCSLGAPALAKHGSYRAVREAWAKQAGFPGRRECRPSRAWRSPRSAHPASFPSSFGPPLARRPQGRKLANPTELPGWLSTFCAHRCGHPLRGFEEPCSRPMSQYLCLMHGRWVVGRGNPVARVPIDLRFLLYRHWWLAVALEICQSSHAVEQTESCRWGLGADRAATASPARRQCRPGPGGRRPLKIYESRLLVSKASNSDNAKRPFRGGMGRWNSDSFPG